MYVLVKKLKKNSGMHSYLGPWLEFIHFFPKMDFVLANSADPDEIPH